MSLSVHVCFDGKRPCCPRLSGCPSGPSTFASHPRLRPTNPRDSGYLRGRERRGRGVGK